jgi:flagellar motor component MotA
MDDDLISKGLNLVVDGTAPNLIDKLLRSRLEKKIREVKARYEAAIEALLAIQAGDHPRMIRERMDSTLS